MTLRLVNDTHEHDGTPTCRSSTSCRNPATILMKFAGRTWLPACDGCARRIYESYPDSTYFAPLADYVDVFAAAKEAALVTPELIAEPAAQEAPAPAPAPVTADYGPWQGIGISAVIGLLIGIMLCVAGAPDGTVSGSQPNIPMILFGILLALGGIVLGLAALFRVLDEHARCHPRPVSHAQPYASGQPGISLGQLAVPAAMVAAEVAWHHRIKQDQARLRDSALGIAPYNNVAAGMRHAERIMARQRVAGDPQAAAAQELQWLNDERPRWVR